MFIYIALSKVHGANKEENGKESNICVSSFLFAVLGNKLASGKAAYISLRVLDALSARLPEAYLPLFIRKA